MGWTYYEYLSQPLFFLESVRQFLVDEQKARLKEIDRQKKEARSKR